MAASRPTLCALVFVLSAAPVAAQDKTWTGAVSGTWNNGANWSPTGVPNSAGNVIFDATGSAQPNVNLSTFGSAGTLLFDAGTTDYTLTSNLPFSLSGVSAITVSSTTTGTQTINLANNSASGSLLFAAVSGPAALLIANNANSTSSVLPTLVIGPNTVLGTSGGGGVTFSGTGTTTFSGSFASSSNQVTGGLTKSGVGVLTLIGNGTNLTGGLTLSGGTLLLDYRASPSVKFNGGLTSAGIRILIDANASSAVTQHATSTSLTGGHTDFEISNSGNNVTLGLGAIARSARATVDFEGDGPIIYTTTTGNTNGLLGTGPAFATIDGRWATNSAGSIQALIGAVNVLSPGTNTELTASLSIPSNITTNSLRFNGNGLTPNIGGVLTLQSGGVLTPLGFSGSTIEGNGTLTTTGGGEILVHANSQLTINARLSSSAGLTKTGDGTLTLGGFNSPLTGPITIHRGSLKITNEDALGSSPAVNFTHVSFQIQAFTVELGDGVNATLTPTIRFSASGLSASAFTNTLSTGASLNSRITLSGVISSAPGMFTPIVLAGEFGDSSGFNLVGANTFTGTLKLQTGTLGINSNASLGNSNNALELSTDNATAGGLEFLSSNITLARPVKLTTDSRIVSNGADVNTISGPLNGSGRLVKAGSGTLVLTGVNTLNDNVEITNGTVRVNAVGLGSDIDSHFIVRNGATLAVSETATYFAPRTIFIGSDTGTGAGTVDVAAGTTFSVQGAVRPIVSGTDSTVLVKSGLGTLALSAGNTYSGGTIVKSGVLQASADFALGQASAPVTVEPLGALIFSGTTTTGRAYSLGGSLGVANGANLTLSGATIGGGFLAGPGTFTVGSGGATLLNTTGFAGTRINQSAGALTATNFTFGGTQTVFFGQTFTGANLNYTASSQLSVSGTANVQNFTSIGRTTVNTGGLVMQQNPNTAAPLTLGGGSVTTVNSGGTINWGGSGSTQLGRLAGGLLINNGNVTGGRLVVDYGGLARGTGSYSVNPLTINGGQFSPGSSPGRVNVEAFIADADGSYLFEINDGSAGGEGPTGTGPFRGWDLTTIRNNANPADSAFFMESTAADPFVINMRTLVAPSPPDVNGVMDDFDSNSPTQWLAFAVDAAATNPFPNGFDPLAFTLNTSGFANLFTGHFSLERAGHNLLIVYSLSPVPEPGIMLLVAAAGMLALLLRSRSKARRLASTSNVGGLVGAEPSASADRRS